MHSLFRKKNKGKYSPKVQTKSISNKELSGLIEQLQKNADQVEKNIVDAEAKMQSDLAQLQEGRPAEHRDVVLQKVSDSEKLLYVLEADAAIAKHMKHPQGDMISEDIRQLKERVTNLRGKHKQVYNLAVKEVDPQVNWTALVDEKLDKLSSQSFGTELPLVDQQVEQHNIFHNEVKAIGPHLTKDGDKEQNSELQAKYQKLLALSQARQQHLSTLQDYMQRCTNELYWLDQQAKGRLQYDWSDRNLDYPSRRRQYENFIHRNLEAKEERVNKLHSEGDQLLAAEHPGRNSIEAHMEAVHADWKEYLNLLICEESHLKFMEDYHQFHKDVKDAQELLRKVDSDLNQKYSPDFKDRYQIEMLLRELDDQEKALDKYEDVVRGLQQRGRQVVPLKYRRETPLKPIPVEALCDFESDEGLISRGYSYTLQKNSGENWELTDSAGNRLTAPAVCFMIPPTDPEALALADSLGSQYRSVRQKAAGSKRALQQRYEVLKAENSGDASDLQGRQLLAGLDQVARDLERQEKAITGILRPPLEQGRAVQDSAERAKDLKNITNELLRIEPEKGRSTAECETFIQALPGSSSVPLLRTRVDDTNSKYERLAQLLNLAQEKVDIANRLEKSLQQCRELLATYESQLTQDDTMPEGGRALDDKRQQLAAMASELQAKKPLLGEAERNLQTAKQCSSSLASRFQEHCPDLERQEAEVHRLSQHFDNLHQQIDHRSQSLQNAKASYDNYHSGYDHMFQFLSNIPSYEPQETDSLSQMETKLKNQKNLLDEIASREQEVQKVSADSQQYQQAVKDYELEAEKLRSLLDLESGRNTHASKRARLQSPAARVKEEEAALAAKFTEVHAVNRQRLQNLEFALNLLRQQPEVQVAETLRGSKAGSGATETWKIRKELEEETQRRQQLENEVRGTQEEILTLQSREPQESVVRKEVLKKIPDPALEDSFQQMQRTLADEQRKNQLLQEELEALQARLRALEREAGAGAGQEYVVKEVLRIEPDRAQEDEVLRLRGELEELRRQKGTREAEVALLRQRITALAAEKSRVREKVTEKEVVKLQNDPRLEAELQQLQEQQQREGRQREKQEEELSFLQDKLRWLEKERAMAEGKITVKEVLKVERDLATEREVGDLKRQYEEEAARAHANQREKTELLRKIWALEEENAKVVVQEKVREIVRPDPKAESEVADLRLELVEQERKHRGAEEQLQSYQSELEALRERGPQVEVKEVTKEVIKYKADPALEQELQRLREEIVDKTRLIERCGLEIYQLKQEIQALRDARPQVQTKEVVQEILQFQEDPQTKEEVETLRAKLSEEQKQQVDLERERALQAEKIREKEEALAHVKERVVQQEVVRYEEDPGLRAEVDSFTESIDAELRQIDTLRGELRRLQRRRGELERQLEELERERQARREAELEVQRLRQRLASLEEEEESEAREKVTRKQKVVLQPDPQQAREHALLQLQLEEERHRRQVLESELETLRKKLLHLEKMEVKEKVVLSESVQVEKGDTEREIQKLKGSMEEESRSKRQLDAEVSRLEAKLAELEFHNSKSSKELDLLREENHRLQLERQNLQLEARRLQAEIEMVAMEKQDLGSPSAVDAGPGLDSRLWSLERELEELKKLSKDKDVEINELQRRLGSVAVKREQRENHLRRSIVVIDPDTGRELSPEEARRAGLIDWNMFVKLRNQECDWEEISVKGPNGESSVIHDRKSGKKFSIEEALQSGRLNPAQYDRYVNKDMSIQELAVLVSGQK